MKSKEATKLDAHPIGSIVLVIIGLAITVGSFRYGFGSFEEPGAGFLPFFTGICTIFFASIPLISSLKNGWLPLRSLWEGTKWYRAIVVTVILFLFCFFLKAFGFVLTSTLLMIGLFRLMYRPKWWVTILSAIATTAFFYVLFQVLLESQLPRGFLGF
jgi:putative tricarboxylic transport membrane protein